MYDSRIGRRWELDPIVKPWESPYATFANNPIWHSDPKGLDAEATRNKGGGDGGGTTPKTEPPIKKGQEVTMPDGSIFKASCDEAVVTAKGGFWNSVGNFFKDLGNGIANGFNRLFNTGQWGNGSGRYDEKSPKHMSDAVVTLTENGAKNIKTDLTKYTSAPNSKGKGEDKIADDLKDNAMEPDESLNGNFRTTPETKPAIKPSSDTVVKQKTPGNDTVYLKIDKQVYSEKGEGGAKAWKSGTDKNWTYIPK
jgi:hypothetical protein